MALLNGITKGKSHKEGGIPMRVKSTGQLIEMEGGEGVTNKTNMADPTKYEFEGKQLTTCEITSELNSRKNNGVKIDCNNIVGKKYKYDEGGKLNNSNEIIDLFVDYENIPNQVQFILDKYTDKFGGIEDMDYADMGNMLYEMNKVGYTFDYGLDNEPYGLRRNNVSLNQLKGYEDEQENDIEYKGDSYLEYKVGGNVEINKYKDKIPKELYKGILGDNDNDGIPNADDTKPNEKSTQQVEEVLISTELESIIDYRNEFVDLRENVLNRIRQIDCGKLKCEIKSRIKTPFSIINKLKRRSLTTPKTMEKLEVEAKKLLLNKSLRGIDLYKGLTDILGFAIIVDDYKQLKKVQKVINDGFLGDVLEMEDFYLNDNNGYRAIHYILSVEKGGQIIPYELQLKTDRVSKLASITHTIYKKGIMNSKENDRIAKKIEKADKGDLEMQKEIDEELKNIDSLKTILTLPNNKNFGGGGNVNTELKNKKPINNFLAQMKNNNSMSGNEVHKTLMEHEFILNKKRNKTKFKLGGNVNNKESVHITLNKDFEASLYDSDSGKFKGYYSIVKGEITNLYFIENNGNTTTFLYPHTNYSMTIPNSYIEIKGFSKKYNNGGGVSAYQSYQTKLSTNDISILELLREVPNNEFTHQNLEFISSFRGTNVVNNISIELINKLFGLMFKYHSIQSPIHSILIKNNGTGNLLNLAPTYVKNVYVEFEQNEFRQIEESISFAQNREKTKFFNGIYSNIDAIVYVYPKINPNEDTLTDYLTKNKKSMICVGVAEFSNEAHLNDFKEYVKNNSSRLNANTTYYKIDVGITSNASVTLIYIIDKM